MRNERQKKKGRRRKNIGAKAAFTPDVLATIPADQELVVYCYTGQTSSQMVAAFNMLGYQAKSMLFGFPAWAMVDGLTGPAPFNPAVDQHDYRISDEMVEAGEIPMMNNLSVQLKSVLDVQAFYVKHNP